MFISGKVMLPLKSIIGKIETTKENDHYKSQDSKIENVSNYVEKFSII